jgi:hypothetical protein
LDVAGPAVEKLPGVSHFSPEKGAARTNDFLQGGVWRE